jgi:hypothetical protein
MTKNAKKSLARARKVVRELEKRLDGIERHARKTKSKDYQEFIVESAALCFDLILECAQEIEFLPGERPWPP